MPSAASKQMVTGRDVDMGVLNDIIGFRIRRIQNHLSRNFAQRMNRPDVKSGVFSALALIVANPGLSQSTLSGEIGFDKATIVAIVDNLEKHGWARRDKAPGDRRRHSLFATPEGEAALQDMLGRALANEAKVRDALTAKEHEQLFRLLDKVYAACFDPEA